MENKSSRKVSLKLKSWFGRVYAKIKPYLKPTMFISFGLAWFITNGWSYVMLGIGIYADITWTKAVGSAYLAFLWLPFTPEKLITIPLAIFIQKLLFRKQQIVINGKEKEQNEKTR